MTRLFGRIEPGRGSGPFTGHFALRIESRRAAATLSAFTRGTRFDVSRGPAFFDVVDVCDFAGCLLAAESCAALAAAGRAASASTERIVATFIAGKTKRWSGPDDLDAMIGPHDVLSTHLELELHDVRPLGERGDVELQRAR